MPFSHKLLIRDVLGARRVLWWAFALQLTSVILPNLSLSYGMYALILLGYSVTLVLFSYILYLGFSRLAKHFHVMPIFWIFVAQVLFNILFSVIDVIEKLAFYGGYDPYEGMISGVVLLTGAVLTFLYGYYIMHLPENKFGKILFRARVANIGKAFLMVALVYAGVAEAKSLEMSAIFVLIGIGSLVMIVVCNIIDYIILGTTLRIVSGVTPHKAPLPENLS